MREQVFELYRDEIPHATAVVVEFFPERTGRPDEVHALYVERDGRKGILLGKGGRGLRSLRAFSCQTCGKGCAPDPNCARMPAGIRTPLIVRTGL